MPAFHLGLFFSRNAYFRARQVANQAAKSSVKYRQEEREREREQIRASFWPECEIDTHKVFILSGRAL
jgi:hypothetical protein